MRCSGCCHCSDAAAAAADYDGYGGAGGGGDDDDDNRADDDNNLHVVGSSFSLNWTDADMMASYLGTFGVLETGAVILMMSPAAVVVVDY